MEHKKVAILLPWMKMGGTNKIALHFMKELSKYCDVTLILSQNTGELLSQIPENINIIIDEMKDFKNIVKEDLKKARLKLLMKDIKYYLNIRIGRDSVDNYRYLVERHDNICNMEFDCAISYHGQSPERLMNLLFRINAKKKVAWIHGEFNNTYDHYRRMEKYYNQLDHLFFVSNHTLESFAQKMQLDKNKATVYYNPIDKNEIITKANEKFTPKFSKNVCNIVTVGRISSEKGQDMIPEIAYNIKKSGHKICWYVIGDGNQRKLLEERIKKFNVSDSVILLGTKTNPYCYMKNCDIYVQPSYTEGYSTTICEAGMLGKAIVGTKPSGGIYDQITDGVNGMIVDATVSGLSKGIIKLLQDEKLGEQFSKRILEKDFEGKGEIEKFISVLNND